MFLRNLLQRTSTGPDCQAESTSLRSSIHRATACSSLPHFDAPIWHLLHAPFRAGPQVSPVITQAAISCKGISNNSLPWPPPWRWSSHSALQQELVPSTASPTPHPLPPNPRALSSSPVHALNLSLQTSLIHQPCMKTSLW